MLKELLCYIDGQWTVPAKGVPFTVINPATEEPTATLLMGDTSDIDRAVTAAHRAFTSFSQTSREERVILLERLISNLEKRQADLASAITLEIGCPTWLAESAQAPLPITHTRNALVGLKKIEFDTPMEGSLVRRVPIGVCGFITPWNWPGGVVMSKIAPALAAGCTVVLKPSEYSPFSAQILSEVIVLSLKEAGLPKGAFNMVYGNGEIVGAALSSHPEVDCVAITGSTRAGVAVAKNAAPSVKRVLQELGGKSPNIILPSADIREAVKQGVKGLMGNCGQNCSGPSRMLVPASAMDAVREAVVETVKDITVGLPDSGAFLGPVANINQFNTVRKYIQAGIKEGATLLAGGPERPEGMGKGYYIRPTVFADTAPDMKIVREEIFGPVVVIQTYADIEEAVRLAVDTKYGLAAYVQGDPEEAKSVADRIPAGQIYLNDYGASKVDFMVPFGGFKRSGNGREWGAFALHDYLEFKALVGYFPENH